MPHAPRPPVRGLRVRAPHLVLAAALLTGGPAACARGTAGPRPAAAAQATADAAAVRAALQASADGWNRADLDAHVAIYADSAAFMTGRGPLRGRDRTAESLRRSFWTDGRPNQALRFERVEVHPLGRDHALAVGRFVLSGGGAAERSGWFSLVWERTPGGWRVIHDHSG